MSESTEIRKQVADSYAKAVSTAGSSCCTPQPEAAASCCGPTSSPAEPQRVAEPKGAAARTAGYDVGELGELPADAVVNSFGCGNPLAFAEVREGQVVVDLGSGAGIDVILAARRVGPGGHAIGIDMTDAMIARARDNIAAAGLENAEIRKGIIEELPVVDASVDWLISNCVINLSPEKPRVFAEIARVLKPGGRFSISDIVVQELPAWARDSMPLYSACVAGAISEAEYVGGLRAAGLEDVAVTERLVYDAAQLRAFAASEEGALFEHLPPGVTLEALAAQLAGNIWSAKFTGRRSVT